MKKIIVVSFILLLLSITPALHGIAMPGETTITTDKEEYVQYEYVTLILSADKNINTDLPISHFKVWASWYNPGGPVYALIESTIPAVLDHNNTYKAIKTDAFQMNKANAHCFIEAQAFDTDGNAGYETIITIYSTQFIPSKDDEPKHLTDYGLFFLIGFLIIIILLIFILMRTIRDEE